MGPCCRRNFVNSTGWANIGANSQTAYDICKRYSFNQDLAFFKTFLGTHNVKVGYGFNHGLNDTLSGVFNTSDVYVAYNVPVRAADHQRAGPLPGHRSARICRSTAWPAAMPTEAPARVCGAR